MGGGYQVKTKIGAALLEPLECNAKQMDLVDKIQIS